jgi:hypothetical protein
MLRVEWNLSLHGFRSEMEIWDFFNVSDWTLIEIRMFKWGNYFWGLVWFLVIGWGGIFLNFWCKYFFSKSSIKINFLQEFKFLICNFN